MDLGHLFVPAFNPIIDPVDEPLAEDDAEAVDRVLPRPLQHLLGGREELAHLLKLSSEYQHLCDLEGFVQRHGDMLHALALDDLVKIM